MTTSQDWVKGTVGYMSPEQVMGTYLTARSDSFALGSLIAALAIGSPPFARDSLESSGKAIVEGDLDPVWPRLVARLPLLSSLVARCVRTRPSERPSSSGIVAELEARDAVPFGSLFDVLRETLGLDDDVEPADIVERVREAYAETLRVDREGTAGA